MGLSNQNTFILVIVIILIVVVFIGHKLSINVDGFESNEEASKEKNSGLYNYFYMRVMNPYTFPMLKFFTNDTQKPLEPNQNF